MRRLYGPGTDTPLVWYEGNGTTDRRWLYQDERGSVIGVAKPDGTALAYNAYDEYGIPQSTNLGRFQYTGQAWLPELGMYYYKARIYSPTLGRFMQSDPIGYGGGMSLYNYVGSDPVNGSDPSGTILEGCRPVTGSLICKNEGGEGGNSDFLSGVTSTYGPAHSRDTTYEIYWKSDGKVIGTFALPNGDAIGSMGRGTGIGQSFGGEVGTGGDTIFVNARRSSAGGTPSISGSNSTGQDYCGSKGTEAVPDYAGSTNIGPACKVHDDCYGKQVGKGTCDTVLSLSILANCVAKGGYGYDSKGQAACALQAFIYDFALTLFGGRAYKEARK